MSDDLYSTRLRWHNGRGVAKLRGRVVALCAAPVLGGEPVHDVDYVPEVLLLEIRRRACDRVEIMTPAEVADADALLLRLVGDFLPT